MHPRYLSSLPRVYISHRLWFRFFVLFVSAFIGIASAGAVSAADNSDPLATNHLVFKQVGAVEYNEDWYGGWLVEDRIFNSFGPVDDRRLVAIDISDPTSPQIAENYHGLTGSILHIDAQHKLIFTHFDRGLEYHELVIYQYPDGGGQVQELFRQSRYGVPPHDVAILDDYAYVAWYDAILIFDLRPPIKVISPPSWEFGVWSFERNLLDIEIRGKYGYFGWEDGLAAVNLTQPTTPTVESAVTLSNTFGIYFHGTSAYMRKSKTGTFEIDISDPNLSDGTLVAWLHEDETIVSRNDAHIYTEWQYFEVDEYDAVIVYDHNGNEVAEHRAPTSNIRITERVRGNFLYIIDSFKLRVFKLEESPAQAVAVPRTSGVLINELIAEVGVEKALDYLAVIVLEKASSFDAKGKCLGINQTQLLLSTNEQVTLADNPNITVTNLRLKILSLEDDYCKELPPKAATLMQGNAALELQVSEGGARFDVAYSGLDLHVITTNTLVTSAGANDFAVGYDPASNTSIIQNYAGSVSVQAIGSPISVTLPAWHQITVTGSVRGPVTKMTSYAYLPSVSNPEPPVAPPPPCTPGPIGESNNIADAITVCSGQLVSGQVSEADLDDVYQILGTAGQQFTVNLEGTGGDADLYIFAPGTDDVTTDPSISSSVTVDSNEFIQFVLPESGFWYIDIFEAAGTTEYTLTATLSSATMATQTTEVANIISKE